MVELSKCLQTFDDHCILFEPISPHDELNKTPRRLVVVATNLVKIMEIKLKVSTYIWSKLLSNYQPVVICCGRF